MNVGDGSPLGGLTISVNTNWFNGFSLGRVHSFLLSELSAVREALGHLRESMSEGEGPGLSPSGGREEDATAEGGGEWERQCELAMRTNSALNMTDFARIVLARARFLLRPLFSPGGVPPASPNPDGAPAAEINGQREGAEEAEDLEPPPVAESTAGEGGGRGGNAWRGEQWKVLALEQIRLVLRDLLVLAPCASHIFLRDDAAAAAAAALGLEDGSTSVADGNGLDCNLDESDGDALLDSAAVGGAPSSSLLRETLASVEAFLAASSVCNGAGSGGGGDLCRSPAPVDWSNLQPPYCERKKR